MFLTRGTTPVGSPFCEEPLQTECEITVWLWRIVVPILFIFGTIGNIINLIVFTRKQIRALPATIFLSFLAGSDLTVLVCTLPKQFLTHVNINLKNFSSFTCIVQEWIGFTAGFYSVWLLVLLTAERLLCTCFPFWARRRITRRVCTIAATIMLIVVSGSMCQMLFRFELKTVPKHNSSGTNFSSEHITVCLVRKDSGEENLNGYWIVLGSVFLTTLPVTIMIIGNIIIARTLFLKRKKVHPESEHSNIHDTRLRSSAKVIFLLCSFSLFTNTPFLLFLVVKFKMFPQVTDIQVYARLQLAQSISFILLLCNYAFNFLLYSYSGSMFRNELRQLMKDIRNRMLAVVRRTETNDG